MKTEICSFSGYKIYPGHGKTYVRLDSRTFRFISAKSASLFLQRKNPRKIHWTVVFRRMHKKGISEEAAKKRSRKTVKHQRAIVGASLDQIKAKRNQRPEVREAQRQQALEAAKKKKVEEETKRREAKKAQAATRGKTAQPKMSKQQAKGAKPAVQAKTR